MNIQSDSMFRWLAARDAGLAKLATEWTGENVEPFLEKLLWESASSFVNNTLRELRCGRSRANDTIQYFSYPLHSHFKRLKQPDQPWISHYPLFFHGGGKHVQASLEVIARYAILYGGLKSHLTGFSFSGFANNEFLKPMPRYIVLDLNEQAAGRSPLAHLKMKSEVAVLTAHIPTSAPVGLPHLPLIEGRFNRSEKHFPLLDQNFDPQNADAFWNWFEQITGSDLCKSAYERVATLAQTLAPKLAPTLAADLLKEMETPPEKADELGLQLATFVAWNFLLGFRRVVYMPYRTLEPQKTNKPIIRSWSGIILCLSATVDLTQEVIPFLHGSSRPGKRSSSPSSKVVPLIAAMKMLVDVATSRASIGDWKYHQNAYVRTVLKREHAGAISRGFEHEIRNLQLLAGLAIREDRLTKEVLAELDGNLAVSQLVFQAYTRIEETLSVTQLLDDLRKLLEIWADLKPDITDHECDRLSPVPYPLLFVLAELCRNGYDHSVDGDKKIVHLVMRGGGKNDLDVVVTNETPNGDMPRRGKRTSAVTFGGLDLVADLVEDGLGGKFAFEIKDGIAMATVHLPHAP